MKKIALAILLAAALVTAGFAHGKGQHVMGTVTAVSADSITVKTTTGEVQKVSVTSETEFVKSGAPAKAQDLKVGDRVVIHADNDNGKLRAENVRFGTPSHQAMHHDMSNMEPQR